LAARYYDQDCANPYARPIAAPDEYDGLRARDELGIRLRQASSLGDFQLRSLVDFWAQISDEAPKFLAKVRGDYEVEQWLIPGIWLVYQNKDISEPGRENCYEIPYETFEGEPVPCGGEKFQGGVQLKFIPTRRLTITTKYQHRFIDDSKDEYSDSFRQDISTWLVVMYRPWDTLRLRARVRYLFEAISDNKYLEQSLWGYLEAAYWYDRAFRVKLRYELFAWLDDRESSQTRTPNPAHWVRLELEYRF